MYVTDVHIVEVIPEFLVDDLRLHDVPPIGVGDDLGDIRYAIGSTCEGLLDVLGVEDGSTALHADSLLEVLHAHVAVVAVVRQIGVGILAGDVTHG